MLAQINQLNNSPTLLYPGQELVIAVSQNPLPAAPAPTSAGETALNPAESGEPVTTAAVAEGELAAAPATVPDAPAGAGASSAICVSAYHDLNSDGVRDPAAEELLPNANFTLSNEKGVVASYTSDGVNEPYCFNQLIPGTYLVQMLNPDGYNATTQDNWAVPLPEGTTVRVEFASDQRPTSNSAILGKKLQFADGPVTNGC
jgi:hypothetical protein